MDPVTSSSSSSSNDSNELSPVTVKNNQNTRIVRTPAKKIKTTTPTYLQPFSTSDIDAMVNDFMAQKTIKSPQTVKDSGIKRWTSNKRPDQTL